MKIANLIMSGIRQNSVFNLNNKLNRDNGFLAWSLLKTALLKQKIEINTSDINLISNVAFEIQVDLWTASSTKLKCYFLMLETSQVCPANAMQANLNKYRKFFTWNDDLVDGKRFIKINFPNPIQPSPVDGCLARNRFCCLISGNKTLSVIDKRDLYVERVKTIRWFERNAPMDFDLYGVDWHLPAWPLAYLFATLMLVYFFIRGKSKPSDNLACFG